MERNKRKLVLPLSTSVTSDTVFSPCFSQAQATGASPMTALSVSMGAMTCIGDTPKRRLSLSEIGETPPSRTSFSRNSSHSSGVSTGSLSPDESPQSPVSRSGPFHHAENSQEESSENIKRPRGLFRRFNSMPLRLQQEDSPSLSIIQRRRFRRRDSILEHQEEEEERWGGENEMKKDEQKEDEDGLWLKIDQPSSASLETESNQEPKAFTFVMPPPKPLSSRTHSQSSRRSSLSFVPSASRPISAPATFLENEDNDDDNIQLSHDRLTSSHDDEDDDEKHDDGFSEIFDSDSQEGTTCNMSEGFAGLLHRTLLSQNRSPLSQLTVTQSSNQDNIPHSNQDCNRARTTPSPGPKCRKGNLFKMPSQPVLMRRNSSFLKRPERPTDTPSPVQNKRPRSSSINSPQVVRRDHTLIAEKENSASKKLLGRSLSMMSPNDPYFQRIDQALSIEGGQNDLIGDRTKACCLPTVTGKQKDLKSISPETMCHLLSSEFSQDIGEVITIDCRYPYEYKGGHIKGALNIYQEDELKRRFLDNPLGPLPCNRRRIFVFHCEFSSRRGPRMLRYLRKEDRSANLENYPALYYPELYILNDGYKAFYQYSTEFCEPRSYVPMDHDNHLEDLRHFRAKSKSWNGEKSRLKSRSHSLF